jgi:hypothetical protein
MGRKVLVLPATYGRCCHQSVVSLAQDSRCLLKVPALSAIVRLHRSAWFVYRVDVMVNAKNSFGGYVGAKKYTFWFRDNQLLTYFVPNDEA